MKLKHINNPIVRMIMQIIMVTVIVGLIIDAIIIPYKIYIEKRNVSFYYSDEIGSITDYLDSLTDSINRYYEYTTYGFDDDSVDIIGYEIAHTPNTDIKQYMENVCSKYDVQGAINFYYVDKDRNIVYESKCFNRFIDFKEERFDTLFNVAKKSEKSKQGDFEYQYDLNLNEKQYGEAMTDSTFFEDHMDVLLNGRDTVRFHITGIEDGYVVSAELLTDVSYIYADSNNWDMLLKDIQIGFSGYFGVSLEDSGELLYCANKDLQGITLDQPERFERFQEVSINGKKYFIQRYKYNEVYLYAITPKAETISHEMVELYLLLPALIIAIVLILIYAALLSKEERLFENQKKHRKGFVDKRLTKKYFEFSGLVCTALVLLAAVLLNVNTFIKNSTDISELSQKTSDLYEKYDELINVDKVIYYRDYLDKLEQVDRMLTENPEIWNKNDLKELADCIDVEYVTIFDNKGDTIATSSPYDKYKISSDPSDPSYECRKVLTGMEELIQDAYVDEFGNEYERISVSHRDKDGIAVGIVQIGVTPYAYAYPITSHKKIETLFKAFSDENIYSFAIDKKTGKFIYFPNENYKDDTYEKIGFTDDMLEDGFMGFIRLFGEEVQIAVTEKDGIYFVTVDKYKNEELPSIVDIMLPFIIFAVFCVLAFWNFLVFKTEILPEPEEEELPLYDDEAMVAEEIQKDIEAEAKKTFLDRWKEANADKKLSFIVSTLWRIVACIIVIFILFRHKLAGAVSIVTFIYDSKWEKGFNIYAIVASIILIATVSFITWAIKEILILVSGVLDARGETISRLLGNLVKYAGILFGLYEVALYFGFNATTAIASVGVLSMALGFGAKDMITDIVAGVFIIFEGTYKVGDMLLIDGEWYWVKSIGIRTTRLDSWGKIKTINNSLMTGIENISNAAVRVNCDLTFSNKYPLEKVEKILEKELPKIKNSFPEDMPVDPQYKGVEQIDSYGYSVRIVTYTPVYQQGTIGRELNRQLVFMLQRNNLELANVEYTITAVGSEKKS